MIILWLVLFLGLLIGLLYSRASVLVSAVAFAILLAILSYFSQTHVVLLTILWIIAAVIFIPLAVPFIRRHYLSRPIFKFYRKVMPTMSETEKEALEAGTTSWEADLFTGKPNWKKFIDEALPKLSADEQAFLDGPVDTVCQMVDNWDVTHHRLNLSDEVWQFLKDNGFFGMIIPKEYGGKGFSARAHSAVITKLASRSVTLSSIVSVPNSLGPAELLLHYGTQSQKDHYLKRLAVGEEIPCFALTSARAGSDAASMPDSGVVCKGQFEGKEVIGIRLNFDKRYITLAPVATVIGLAFKLYDPDQLLSKTREPGITCALIPSSTSGVKTGKRHFPLNCAFPNGPVQGKDVFIPAEWIIGGPEMAGQGWKMLMNCLAEGRAISLPSTVTGGAKMAAFATGAYARVRKQFRTPIAHFEGIEEALANIAGRTYVMDAVRLLTVSAVDKGEKPAVASAISKYHTTEMGQQVIKAAMDIHGGKGICLGPKNYLGRFYQELPISITVEGANILTRSMIIFGQGAIASHPFVLDEIHAGQEKDLHKFDKAIFGHLGMMGSNKVRAFLLGLTGGLLASSPKRMTRRYFQQLSRFASAFAFAADCTMMVLGASLKRRERLSARLGDVLSQLYMGSAVLKKFHDAGAPKDDLPVVEWALQTILYNAQQTLSEIIQNYPNAFFKWSLRCVIFPLGKHLKPPSDRLSKQVAKLFIHPTPTRRRLSDGIYRTPDANNQVGLLDEALNQVIAVEPLEAEINKALKAHKIRGADFKARLADAVKHQVITQAEADQILAADKVRDQIIAVDAFTQAELGLK